VGLGPLTVEGLAEGRYRILREAEVVEMRKKVKGSKEAKG
jgi:hypothetical protein